MLYKELKEYNNSDIQQKCIHLLKYFIEFNARKAEKLKVKEIELRDRHEYKYEFERCTEKIREYLLEQKVYLRGEIIKTMRILDSMSSFKSHDVYLALKDDLEDMENDLKAILLLFRLIKENLYNLNMDTEMLNRYAQDIKKGESI